VLAGALRGLARLRGGLGGGVEEGWEVGRDRWRGQSVKSASGETATGGVQGWVQAVSWATGGCLASEETCMCWQGCSVCGKYLCC
jgi:hypothetical protein